MLVIFVAPYDEILDDTNDPHNIFERQRYTLKQNFYTVALQEAEMQGFEIQNLNSSFSSWRGGEEGRDPTTCDLSAQQDITSLLQSTSFPPSTLYLHNQL